MIVAVEELARSRWADWFPDDVQSGPFRLLMTGPLGDSPEKAMLLFLFKGQTDRPHAVAKVARVTEAERLVEHEHRFLTRVRSALPEDWKASVPRPLGLERIEGRLVFVQSCLPGRHLEEDVPASASLKERSGMDAMLNQIAEWWITFRRATANPAEGDRTKGGSKIPDVIEAFIKAFEPGPEECRFLDHYSTGAASLLGAGAALGGQHGDFCNLNVIVNQGRIGVIDWAFGREARPPWTDLYTFATTFYWIPDRGSRPSVEDALDRSYLDDNWLSRSLGRWLSRCAAAEAVSGEAMALSVPLVFIENALIGPRQYGRVRESDRSWRRRFGRLVSQWDRFRALHEKMVRP